jgi:enamine deaminase RidA (YjgF/YER057c/UK114 family)
MSRVAERLTALGLVLPEPAIPVASYVPAVLDGDLVWTSGQLPFENGRLHVTGRVGVGEGLITPEKAAQLAEVCVLNALAAIRSVIDDLDRLTRIVKVVGYVASSPDFSGQPAVLNGASTLLERVFGESGRHARSAVGVAVLPLDSPVELDIVAVVR